MALLSFPSSPFNGEVYPSSPVLGQNQYEWSDSEQTWRLLGAATGVVPDTYGDGTNVGQFTVNAQGVVTFAQNVPIASGAGGTVTDVTAGTGLTGGTIISSGTIALDMAYTDARYLQLTGGTLTGAVIFAAGQTFPGAGTVTDITAGTGLTGGAITSSGTIALADTAIIPGTYSYPTLTVDQQGRLTSASSNTAPITCLDFDAKGDLLAGAGSDSFATLALGVNDQVLTADSACATGLKWGTITQCQGTVTSVVASIGLTGGTITSSGTIALADTAVSPGSYTYSSLTVDAQGRLTAASSGTAPVTAVTASGALASSGGLTPDITLNDTAVSPGSYTYASLTVDQQGRLTSASSGTSPITCLDFDAKGDILVGYGADSFGVQGVGTNGQVLTADSACTSGLKWNTITQCQGTVTSVAAGTGLCSTTITTSGTLDLANATPTSIGGIFGRTNSNNTALGVSAHTSGSGTDNIAIGPFALGGSGSANIAIGSISLPAVTSGSCNIAMGIGAGLNMASGSGNIGIGFQALVCATSARNNVEIGANDFIGGAYSPPFQITTECNRVVIGSTATTNAYVQVGWTTFSDIRDKTEVTALPVGLDFVTQLEPISYRFKESRDSDEAVGPVRYGFSAQQVLETEGENPVVVDTENLDKLKITDANLIPILVQAIKDLKAEVDALKSQD